MHQPSVNSGLRHVLATQDVRKWAIPVFFFVLTLVFSLLYHWPAPVADHWYIVKLYTKLKDGDLFLSDLFKLHGAHWHASGYIVQLALAEVTAMAHWAESMASVVFAGLGFLALARMLDRCVDQLRLCQATLWIYGLSSFLYFSLDQAANWLWGWQVAVFISNAGALWSIERLTRGTPTLLNTTLAAVAAAVSVYGFGTGWVLVPMGFGLLILFGAFRSRAGIGSLALWAALTVFLLLHFFSVYTTKKALYVDKVTPDFFDPATYVGLVHFAVNFVTSPLIGSTVRDIHITVPLSLIGMGILIWSLRMLSNGNRVDVILSVVPFLSLAVFAVGCGLLTGLGRWEVYGANQAFVSRLNSFGTFFWIAVFVLASLAIAKRGALPQKRILVVLGVLLVLKFSNIPGIAQKKIENSYAVREAAEFLSESYPDVNPAEYSILYAPEQKVKVEGYLRTLWIHKVSVFATNRDMEE